MPHTRNPAPGAGFFTVIDGQAGVGKTTVTALTVARLAAQGLPALTIRQPSDSALGILARASTHNLRGLPLTFLMAADRYYQQDHVIGPALASGRLIVCDRYVTTAMVLDQMDGAEPEYLWNIYRYLAWPDLAIVLTGDPAICRARAARRGIYSRFHEGGTRAGETEAAFYASTAAMLADYGYPIHIVQIHDQTADQVSEIVIGLIYDHMATPPANPQEGGADR